MIHTTGLSHMARKMFALCLSVAFFLMLAGVVTPVAAADAGFTDCPGDVGKTIMDSLNQAERFKQASGLNQIQDSFDESQKQFAANPTGPRPSAGVTMCLNDVLMYFDLLAGLMSAGSAIEKAITGALSYFLNSVCTWVKSAIQTTIQNALDLICIPLPDIGYSLSLPSIKRKSCNGYAPLRDMMTVQVVPGLNMSSKIPSNMISSTLSRWIEPYNVKGGYSLRNGRF